jgi:hypothetical protein
MRRRDVAYWHFSEVASRLAHVRYRRQPGQHMLGVRFSQFDPSATSCVQICCGAQGGFSLSGVVG